MQLPPRLLHLAAPIPHGYVPAPHSPALRRAPNRTLGSGGAHVRSDDQNLLLTSFKLEMRPEEELERPKRFSMVVRLLLK